VRCFGDGDPLYEAYHDAEWGRPQLSERQLYEKVCLEAFQAGLAWITVLRKREALREVFGGFDPEVVAETDVEPLLADARLIRSRAKLQACVTNARATLALRPDGGLPALVTAYATWTPAPTGGLPASTPGSTALSRQLKRAGFTFVGPVTAYSLLQACGLVGDHLLGCDVREDVEAERRAALAGP
jgi:DNA-3-methyladenine glycosylase I